MEHEFSAQIHQVLASSFGEVWEDVYGKSTLLQYLNIKTSEEASRAYMPFTF